MSQKITLTLPDQIVKTLEKEMDQYAYFSVQEIILEMLRDKYYRELEKKETRGRPRKLDESRLWRTKKIFSKDGEKIRL